MPWPMTSPVLLHFVAVMVIAASQTGGRDPAMVGRAYEVVGNWIYQRSDKDVPRRISEGVELPGGALIRPPTAELASLVVIYNDGKAVRFECPHDCQQPVRLKTDAPARSEPGSGPWEIVQRLFWNNPVRYVVAITRGGSAVEDAVLPQTGKALDLAPALLGLPSGRYAGRLRVIPRAGTRQAPIVDLGSLTWNGSPPLQIDAPTIRPTLHELEIRLNGSSTIVGRSWVLVVNQPSGELTAASFNDAREATEQWKGGVKESQRRGLLRAYLEVLAERGPSK